SRPTSSVLSCSTRTHVRSPAIWTSGLKMRGGAERDVGASTTVDSGRSSAWTTTPRRGPRCSCPEAPRAAGTAYTSPRINIGPLLHRLLDRCAVGRVGHGLCGLGPHLLPAAEEDSVQQGAADRL